MITAPPVCMDCKHFKGARKCDAFPDRIPDVIWLKGDPHTSPVAGDHGIQFEPLVKPTGIPNRE
jgi:hypothetical protein